MTDLVQSAEVLTHLKEVVADLMLASDEVSLTPLKEKVLDGRIERHNSGNGKTYSWEEVLVRLSGSPLETSSSL